MPIDNGQAESQIKALRLWACQTDGRSGMAKDFYPTVDIYSVCTWCRVIDYFAEGCLGETEYLIRHRRPRSSAWRLRS
jgi:hypothetical protein